MGVLSFMIQLFQHTTTGQRSIAFYGITPTQQTEVFVGSVGVSLGRVK